MEWWTFIKERERSQKSCGDGGASKLGQRDGERKDDLSKLSMIVLLPRRPHA
jgi:hypothetical protein